VAVSIEPGTRLGSYEVQEFIGQGAMGLVYRAYHPQLERFGAVKVLQGIASTPDGTARFRHEAQAIAQMRHPNIVNVYDFGEYEGTPYMIVEYVPGGNLASKMEQKPLDRTIALRYLRGIAAGLDYAHSLGIVHRDVKPGNVLLEKDETPVLADFGLVKLLQGSSIQSMTGVTTGTPAYMAPEQVMGHQVGPAADRYSLATMAYEMLTGVIPFDGDGVLELLYAHVHREPPAPSTRIAALTPAVDAVILRGLAKAPEARWDTATAFVEALALALAGQAPEPSAATVRMPPPAGLATKPLASKSRARQRLSPWPCLLSIQSRRRRRQRTPSGAGASTRSSPARSSSSCCWWLAASAPPRTCSRRCPLTPPSPCRGTRSTSSHHTCLRINLARSSSTATRRSTSRFRPAAKAIFARGSSSHPG
jgi:serine/threonine protein kinase